MKIKKMLSHSEIASFCSQTAMILNAGIGPEEGMNILLQDTKNPDGQSIITQIRDICAEGNTFYEAIEATDVFPEYVLHMIKLGETSGNLDVVMQSLADYYEHQQNISDGIHNAILYPMIMIAMMLVVILVLITKVLPIFNQVFEQLGTEMNAFSLSLLKFGSNINRYAVLLIVLLCILALCYLYFTKTTGGKVIFTRFAAVFPLTRGLYDQIATSKFASGLAMNLKSGTDTYTGVGLLANLVENPRLEAKIIACRDAISAGANFSDALQDANIFSSLYSRMISVGFRTGSIDTVMDRIAYQYEKEIDDRIRHLIAILEPTLVIILSLIVGMILLSVILPLMGIMSSIG